MYSERKREIKEKINRQIQDNEKLKCEIEDEQRSYELEMQSLQKEIDRLESEKQRHKKQYQNAVDMLGRKMQNNVYVDKRRAILTAWCEIVQKEKSA